MVSRFWIILVLILCVFIVFLWAPIGEEKTRQTASENAPVPLFSINQ